MTRRTLLKSIIGGAFALTILPLYRTARTVAAAVVAPRRTLGPVTARTWYVRRPTPWFRFAPFYGSKGTISEPFYTIQEAIDSAGEGDGGDTIYLMAGHDEPLTINADGVHLESLTIEALDYP